MTIALDFETRPITVLTPYPEPVGLSITQGRTSQYLSWGHARGNNCSRTEARKRLYDIFKSGEQLVFFNALFDCAAALHLGLKVPWQLVHDAQVLAFLHDPRARRLDLKSTAERVLHQKPGERDKLREWIQTHVPGARRKKKNWGAHIAEAPGDIVAPYARGDTRRTLRLFNHWERLQRSEAYQRERSLLPILSDMHEQGIPIDRARLARDLPTWERWVVECERWLRKRLQAPGLDLSKAEDVAVACERRGMVDEWITNAASDTISLSVESLRTLVVEGHFHDTEFVEVWAYYSYLDYILRTFVRPWLAHAEADGHLHATWAATRKEGAGARTGRFSSSPNVQNIPKRVPTFRLPRGLRDRVGSPPSMRSYVIAPRGQVLVGADISQQELRILAHFVGDPLSTWYLEDPGLDLHLRIRDLIYQTTQMSLERNVVKVVNFCTIYGGGAQAVSEQAGCSKSDAYLFRQAHRQSLPGISDWDARMHEKPYFETAGGRRYVPEPGWEYKDVNYAIQGSAADQLKECMVDLAPKLRRLDARLALSVHDELVALAPTRAAREVRRLIKDTLEDTGVGRRLAMFTVPMVAETYTRKSWESV